MLEQRARIGRPFGKEAGACSCRCTWCAEHGGDSKRWEACCPCDAQSDKLGTPPLEIAGRTVIVVDDGIATGGTVKAALAGIRRSAPARLVLAVPVAPEETIDEMKALADEVICLAMPEPFQAVGLHYVDFTQTRDAEVIGLMDRSREWKTA